MRVTLLGVVGVTDGSVTVSGTALGGRRARIVLALLALAGGPVPADTLAAAVWGDDLPTTWPTALRGTIRALRTALAPLDPDGRRVITTVPAGYCLAPDVEVDVEMARASVRRASALLAEQRFRAALDTVAPVVEFAGMPLLPDEDADWLAPHRAAARVLVGEGLSILSAAASGAGEHDRALEAARHAVAADPLDERAHRAVIRAFAHAGDRAGAIRAYERCRATLAAELGIDPSAETIAAYLDATAGQPRSTRSRIPADRQPLIGRAAELAGLAEQVARPGLITLAGNGGVGKTRLAAAAAAQAEAPGGRCWVSLSGIGDDALVAVSVALELRTEASAAEPIDAVAAHLAPLGPALLVLDGGDAVPDGVATLAATVLEQCPLVTVLITSRAPLGLPGEQVVALKPLAPPASDDPAAVRQSAAAQLLQQRVRAAGGDLELDDGTAPYVAELCRRCGGLPLALELAAAQLGDLAIGDLLDVIGSGGGDLLRAITSSSYALLEPDEAAVFRRLGVLDGRVGVRFVRAVVSGEDVAEERVVRILHSLTARGLVTVDRSGPRWQYAQDDDVHRFAHELLVASGRVDAAYLRLADAIRALLPADARDPPAPFAAEVSAVAGSVRSLLAAGIAGAASADRCLELAFRLHRYWAATSVAEGRFWLGRLLAVPGASSWRRYATYALGYLNYWAGHTDDALRGLRAAIEQFGDEPDPFLARAYIYVAGLLDDLDRPAEALDYVRRSVAAAEPFGTDLYVAAAMGMGSVLSERGDPEAARYAGDAVARCRMDGSPDQLATLLPTAAMVCWQVGALDDARSYLADARPLHSDHKRIARVVLLSTAAGLALADGDIDAAVDHGRRADAEGTELGVEREMPLVRAVLARALLARGDLTAAADRALAGIDSAAAMAFGYPLAISLECAALVADRLGTDDGTLGPMLRVAADLRASGDRPAPATLRADVAVLRARLTGAVPSTASVADAVPLARRALARRQ